MTNPESTAVEERDDRLAGLLSALTEDRRAGREADVESIARNHPDLAEELRALWAAAEIAEEMARDVDDDSTLLWTPDLAPASTRPEAREGQQVGDCRLLEELGRGGMGVVHRALQTGLNRVVAIKRMHAGGAASPLDRARFRAEAEAAARLDHPNIVPVYAVDSLGIEPYILMRYVEGTTLARRLAEGPMPALEAARLLAPVCRAIQFAHDHGVLHRDLKPSNVLIDSEGRPHVSDFGLAKRVDGGESLTRSGAVLGTPSYTAPEQAAAGRGPVGPASDVYALGAVLYQMLTGRPPFLAATPLDTILLVLEQDPVPPRLLNPKANADLEMVALKCLQKTRELRYTSASALADDLDAFLDGAPVSARSTGLRDLVSRLMGETHHAAVLENWGALWMMHSAALVSFYGLANWLLWRGVSARWPYFLIFTVGLGAWASIFWALRRRGGPITFVERLLAHVWGSGVVAINLLFLVEWLLGMPVFALAPVLAITNGMLFMIKGGILSGAFYPQAAAVFLAVFPMAWFPRFAPIIFGVVAASCFFTTGLQAFLRRRRSQRLADASEVQGLSL
jgi:eukaryotic-like serine/threonine-protein kinase